MAAKNRPPPTTRSLPFALIRAREGVMTPIRAMLAETGITEQQWRVLRTLNEYGSLDASTLSDRASLLFPSLTRIAKTMAAKGLIQQNRDAHDRRYRIIAITKAGQKIIDDNAEEAANIAQEFENMVGQEKYDLLLDLLALFDLNHKELR